MPKDDDATKEPSHTEDELFLRAMKDPDFLESLESAEEQHQPSRNSFEKADELFLNAMNNPDLVEPEDVVEQEISARPQSEVPAGNALQTEDQSLAEEEGNLFKASIESWIDEVVSKDEDIAQPVSNPRVSTKWKAIKNGKIRPDLTLDLHHQSEEQARNSFSKLLKASRNSPEVALVIVGKGLHSKGKAILRTAVPGWLAGEYSTKVARWEWAPRHLGGAGAVLILLNRNQES